LYHALPKKGPSMGPHEMPSGGTRAEVGGCSNHKVGPYLKLEVIRPLDGALTEVGGCYNLKVGP